MQIYISRDGEQNGPYGIEDVNAYLEDGTLLPTDLACQDGMTEWVPISQIPGVAISGDSVETPIPPSQPVPNGNKKKILIGIGAGMGLLALIAGIWFFFIRGAGGKEQLSNNDGNNSSAAKPDKELTIEEKVIGEYEIKSGGDNYRIVFLENGKMFYFVNGEKDKTEGTWRVVGKEVHGVGTEKAAYKIDPNGDLTSIAEIDKDGKRKEIPKEEQQTLKKIKSESKGTSSKGDDNNSTTSKPVTYTNAAKSVKELTLRDKIVGEYESKIGGNTLRFVFLDNGIAEGYHNGKKREEEGKWKLTKEDELHDTYANGNILVFSINKDGSITIIARIDAVGKREEAPKDKQMTFKKIK